ncbi:MULTISPECIES: dipeptidase [Jonquetella]|uniref:Dipeptidase n=1 Tax=Jonquetella anthropi DSM 22815 TaxID=885272 RepID=H0UM57_9BACT|nr:MULTISPECIES: C69 family dipeptidase [Jonquetella]EHM13633.1 dipeptidase [Jonquetella anthropi DSM 22815]ERL24548.1 peptidase, C69 family [Jonquetella sp. BV3C21]
MKKRTLGLLAAAAGLVLASGSAWSCTVLGIGKNATADGSAMITHNDDSRTANSRLFIIPEADWPEGSKRPIIKDAHGYEGDAQQMDEIDQVPHTYRYFFSRYSFMNEKGVAIGEATNGVQVTDERSKKVQQIMEKDAVGSADAWVVQDVALERAKTAREAVSVMGKLVEEVGWYDSGETMPITDGNEVWIMEFYGNKIWAAWRVPDDQVFVAANRARLRHLDLTDKDNVMYCPDLVDYAVKNGFIAKEDVNMKDFSPADVYSPNTELYAMRREWRVFSLIAPESFKGGPDDLEMPMSFKPDKKLTVDDVFRITGDWYGGTDYDLSKGPAAGPWGNPLRYANSSKENPDATWERSINMMRTCYVHIAQVRGDLPEEVRGISWYGYGAPDTTYITPLWPIMTELPALYSIGDRFHDYDSKSGWWTCTRVQELATLHYQDARKDIHAAREPKLNALYLQTRMIQDKAAELIKDGKRDEAINLITQFACANATDWHERWLALGDKLMQRYSLGYVNYKTTPYPEWWNKFVGYGSVERKNKSK